jgi:Protein of unknown function (DUF2785)
LKKTCVLATFLFLVPIVSGHAVHDRAFWQSIAKNNYAVPEHESADTLATELSSLLASPDPELRDDLAYSILARWIYRDRLSQSELINLTDKWRANLKDGLGETGTNSVLKRSFSALCLASMARREAKAQFMGEQRYHQLVSDAIVYLKAERDLRGYDAQLHWIHATAHTADLLAALAGSARLTPDESNDTLSAISARVSTAPDVFTQGEQDRLAAAVVAVIHRPQFDQPKFEQWLAGIQKEDRDIWTNTTPQTLARYQNHTYLLQALFARMALASDSSRMAVFKQTVLAVLKDRMD